ncbi:MFS transporter [Kushneria marisflavi]|uniref:MFS transporter n=1 Tax=Kushneria marisflavi TaxID=157779 RepID=A0A240UL93_9GAMM|nr:MFS transporter [Kushneria marisflavi]ART62277.1 MFS transporter [Kushneria marisflavi]RKD87377.1 putative MFS family arabinose efflux permease [Kushneria marisflavi]
MPDVSRIVTCLIAAGAFALGMASYVTAGLIPLIEQDFGVTTPLAAQLVTAFTLAYALGSPVMVAILPAHRQRAALLGMLVLFVTANALSAVAPDMTMLMSFRAVAGLAAGTYLALGIAAASRLAPDHQRGHTIAIIMGGMASGTVLGVPAGLWLADHLGWQAALWLISLIGAVALLGLMRWLPALSPVAQSSLKQKFAILKDAQVVRLLGISLLAAVASLGLYTFMAPLISAYTEHNVTPFLWVWGVGGVLGSFLVGSLVDRFSNVQITTGILVLLSLSLIALPLALSLNPWLALLPIILWGAVGWALQVPQNNALMKAREASGDGHLAVALNESALYLGSALGAGAGGVWLSLGWPVWGLAVAAGVIGLMGLGICLPTSRGRGRVSHPVRRGGV